MMSVTYEEGFEYASGVLMKNPCQRKVDELLGMIEQAHAFDNHTDFDKGMRNAIACYEKLRLKVRNEKRVVAWRDD